MRVLVAEANDKLKIFSVSGVKMSQADLSGLKDAKVITVAEAELPAITLPATAPNLTDLNLDGNELTEIDLSKFPKLFVVVFG